MRTVLLGIIGICAVFAGLLIAARPQLGEPELREMTPERVSVEAVVRRDVRPVDHISGELHAVRRARLSFDLGGWIAERDIEPGYPVEQGSVLLRIESGDYQDAVDIQNARLRLERESSRRDKELLALLVEDREIQQRELERVSTLEKQSLASLSSYEGAYQQLLRLRSEEVRLRHNVSTADARLAIERSSLNQAERALEETALRAPFSGTVSAVLVELGDYVTPGQKVLDLVQIDELDLLLSVSGALLQDLHMGQQITVTVAGSERRGTIVAMGVEPDPQTNTHSLRIRIDGEGLYPGQIARATLPNRELSAVTVIPITAVLGDNDRYYVFVVEQTHLRRKEIDVLSREDDYYVVDGIDSGIRIVSRDVNGLVDNQQVKIR